MFVTSNKASDLKKYFQKKLELHFSPSEVKFMFSRALEKRLQLKPEDLLLINDLRLSESDLLFVRTIVHRLLENEPFQYIIGETEFCNLNLKTDKRALIPRPETEELVEWIRTEFDAKAKLKIIDFCTGSGCIALALKHCFRQSKITGMDVSEDALNLACENAQLTALEVTFTQADVLNFDAEQLENYSVDCIVSNPPYIPEMDKNSMADNVLNFEPHLALFVSDKDKFVFYKKIAEIALNKLKPGGKLFFEIHEQYAEELESLIQEIGFQAIEIKEDLQGKKRMLKTSKA